ncbi:MAG: YhgE/Pip family protein [Sciscionella sp.]
MTAIRLAINELRRFTTGRLPKLALVGLLLVPLLYGAMYVYANWDPYGRLGNIPVALVNADTGAKGPDGKVVNAGDEVTGKLEHSGKFEWHQVDSAAAEQGVRDGTYAFSLTMPKDFSTALVSPANFQPKQGLITLTTNDANNYLVRTIADNVLSEVRKAVAERVGTQAAERLLTGYSTIHDQLSRAADGATQLANGSKQLSDGQRKLRDGSSTAADGASQLYSGLSTLRAKTSALPGQTSGLASGAKQVASGTAQVAGVGNQISSAADGFAAQIDSTNGQIAGRMKQDGFSDGQINKVMGIVGDLRQPLDAAHSKITDAKNKLNALNAGAQRVSSGASRLAGAAPALASGIDQAASGARQLATGTGKLRDGENQAVPGTDKLHDGATQLQRGLKQGLGQVPNPNANARNATAKTIADPTAVRNIGDAQAATYGAGLSPFFLALAAWIGAFVLFLLFKPLSSRALVAGKSAATTVLGGWLPTAAMGVAQMVILYAVVTLAVGLHPELPLATLGFLLFASISNVALIHGLNALLGAVGKFLGLVLLILQLASAGGTFPWQTIPDVLYPLHFLLPMGYVIDGLRHLMYGGSLGGLGLDVAVLAGWLLAGLGMGLLAARKQRVWTPARLHPELAL